MKIAEALIVRSDMQKKLAALKQRVGNNVIVQEGDAPHEDPGALIAQSFAVQDALESLVVRINEANQSHLLADGRKLSQAVAQRETLMARHALISHAVASTNKEPDRYSMKEIKWVAVIKVAALQKQADDLAQAIREINIAIQETNWKAELA
ncbi:MAG TPA: DIP1984 family protein [Burkholderiales bacterium]|jgi:L-rhamnose isomerase